MIFVFMSIGLSAQEAFLLRYESRDTRHIEFPQVDG